MAEYYSAIKQKALELTAVVLSVVAPGCITAQNAGPAPIGPYKLKPWSSDYTMEKEGKEAVLKEQSRLYEERYGDQILSSKEYSGLFLEILKKWDKNNDLYIAPKEVPRNLR